jgi:predicted GNAT family acetyltransferase
MSEVRHNPERSRYELQADGGLAFADYIQRGNVLVVTHTETPPALQGRGVASRLVKGMLADVRSSGQKVMPLCSFVADYFERHPEEQDVLEQGGD